MSEAYCFGSFQTFSTGEKSRDKTQLKIEPKPFFSPRTYDMAFEVPCLARVIVLLQNKDWPPQRQFPKRAHRCGLDRPLGIMSLELPSTSYHTSGPQTTHPFKMLLSRRLLFQETVWEMAFLRALHYAAISSKE